MFKDFCVLPGLCESFMTISKMFETDYKSVQKQQ